MRVIFPAPLAAVLLIASVSGQSTQKWGDSLADPGYGYVWSASAELKYKAPDANHCCKITETQGSSGTVKTCAIERKGPVKQTIHSTSCLKDKCDCGCSHIQECKTGGDQEICDCRKACRHKYDCSVGSSPAKGICYRNYFECLGKCGGGWSIQC